LGQASHQPRLFTFRRVDGRRTLGCDRRLHAKHKSSRHDFANQRMRRARTGDSRAIFGQGRRA